MENNTLTFVAINEEDKDYLYRLQNIKGIRKFALNPNVPSYEEHEKWFTSKFDDNDTHIFRVIDHNECVGVIRLDVLSDAIKKTAEISLTIDPKFAGRGYASKAVNKLINDSDVNTFHAVIHEDNVASQKVFLKNGFVYQSLYKPNFNLYIYKRLRDERLDYRW